MIQIGKCAGASPGMQTYLNANLTFYISPPILAWAPRSRQAGDPPILVFYKHISSILFVLYFYLRKFEDEFFLSEVNF